MSKATPRRLASAGLTFFPIALGAMRTSHMYGASDDEESIASIHAALVCGATLIATGDFYGRGHNGVLIGRVLPGCRQPALLTVKFGSLGDTSGGWTGVDNRPIARERR